MRRMTSRVLRSAIPGLLFSAVALAGVLELQNPVAEPQELWMVTAPSESQAEEIRRQAAAGSDLDGLGAISLGEVRIEDLRGEFREALAGLDPGALSPVFLLDGDFVFLRWGAPADVWTERHESGVEAFGRGDYEAAAAVFEAAVREAERTGAPDLRLVRSLTGLAETHRLREEYAEALPLYRRVLTIREAMDGQDAPDLAPVLNNLAEMYRLGGEASEAEPLYARALSILEATPGTELDAALILNNLARTRRLAGAFGEAEGYLRRALTSLERSLPADDRDLRASRRDLAAVVFDQGRYVESAEIYRNVLRARWGGGDSGEADARPDDLLETLAALLTGADFRDRAYDGASRRFAESLQGIPDREELPLVLRNVLVDAELLEAAENVMIGAVTASPDSVRLRSGLGEFYQVVGRLEQALAVLEAAADLGQAGAPPAEGLYAPYVRLAEVHSTLGDFDAAIAAYERAHRAVPASAGSRVALGDLYLGRNMIGEAEAEYQAALANDRSLAAALRGLAEVSLRRSRYEDAAAMAEQALAVDPDLLAAQYVLAVSRIRNGEAEEGQRRLAAYREAQAAVLAKENKERLLAVLNRDAVAAFLSGDADRAVALFSEGIAPDAEPDAGLWRLYSNLGVAYERMEEYGAAAETLEAMLEAGCCSAGASFLAHRSLSALYMTLGEEEASRRHHALYLREYDSALDAHAP